MECSVWIIIIYTVIGLLCAFHWFEADYGEDYKKACQDGEEEKGMTSMLLLLMTFFWPFVAVYKGIKKML